MSKFNNLFDKIINENIDLKEIINSKEKQNTYQTQARRQLLLSENQNDLFKCFCNAIEKNTNIMNMIFSMTDVTINNSNSNAINDLLVQIWMNYGQDIQNKLFTKISEEQFKNLQQDDKTTYLVELFNDQQAIEIIRAGIENFNTTNLELQNHNPEDNVQEYPEDY